MSRELPKLILNVIIVFLFTILGYSQVRETEKVFLTGRKNLKYQSPLDYTLTIGYNAAVDRDIYFEFTGGPSKYKISETVPVKAGKGRFTMKIGGEEGPVSGKGYKVFVALREKGGKEQTTKSSIIVNNIELVNEKLTYCDNASFSESTATSLDYDSSFNFIIDFSFLEQKLVQVSIFKNDVLVSSSEIITIMPGSGSKDIKVSLPNNIVGTDFKYVLNFGTEKDFKDKTTKSEEILGVTITKPITYTISELSEKSIKLDVNNNVATLELPGDPIYENIKVIDTKGKVVRELFNANKINIGELASEKYFVITNSGYYFKFTKGF